MVNHVIQLVKNGNFINLYYPNITNWNFLKKNRSQNIPEKTTLHEIAYNTFFSFCKPC